MTDTQWAPSAQPRAERHREPQAAAPGSSHSDSRGPGSARLASSSGAGNSAQDRLIVDIRGYVGFRGTSSDPDDPR